MESGVHLESKAFLAVQDLKVNEETVTPALSTHRMAQIRIVSMYIANYIKLYMYC